MKNTIYNFVCKGFIVNYTNLLETDPSLKNKDLLEYAIIYGRYNILFHMSKDDYYINLLQDDSYDPFNFSCEVDVAKDVHDNTYWGNDERERSIVNKKNIMHKQCFELLRSFNKKLKKKHFEKWYSLYTNFKYYMGSYFPDLDILLNEMYNYEKPSLTQFIQDFETRLSTKKLIKIIFEFYNPDELIKKLKD